jgi:PKD repeat protein
MKSILLALSVFLLIACYSCSKDSTSSPTTPTSDPVAAFTYSGTENFSPCAITFSNTSTDATSYQWDFGDNGTSQEVSPKHNYLTQGTYTVQLIATNTSGKSNTTSKTINIKPQATKMNIIGINITSLPPLNPNGSGWDVGSGPDVAFEFFSNGQSYGKSSTYNDVLIPSGLPLSWTYGLSVNDLSKSCSFKIYDIDLTANDLMGTINFVPKDYVISTPPNNYPSTIQLTSGQITMILNVSWE